MLSLAAMLLLAVSTSALRANAEPMVARRELKQPLLDGEHQVVTVHQEPHQEPKIVANKSHEASIMDFVSSKLGEKLAQFYSGPFNTPTRPLISILSIFPPSDLDAGATLKPDDAAATTAKPAAGTQQQDEPLSSGADYSSSELDASANDADSDYSSSNDDADADADDDAETAEPERAAKPRAVESTARGKCDKCVVRNVGFDEPLSKLSDRFRRDILKICTQHGDCLRGTSFACNCAGPGLTNCSCPWWSVNETTKTEN